jgi:dihydroorotase-like cyclic amidohydrolase
VIGYNTNKELNPPLRGPEDVEEVKRGLAVDVIDFIATDHASPTPMGKSAPFEKVPFGIIGLETAVPFALSREKARMPGSPPSSPAWLLRRVEKSGNEWPWRF